MFCVPISKFCHGRFVVECSFLYFGELAFQITTDDEPTFHRYFIFRQIKYEFDGFFIRQTLNAPNINVLKLWRYFVSYFWYVPCRRRCRFVREGEARTWHNQIVYPRHGFGNRGDVATDMQFDEPNTGRLRLGRYHLEPRLCSSIDTAVVLSVVDDRRLVRDDRWKRLRFGNKTTVIEMCLESHNGKTFRFPFGRLWKEKRNKTYMFAKWLIAWYVGPNNRWKH